MALQIRPTSAFERDVRRALKRGKDLDKLDAVVSTLQAGRPLAARCRAHPLRGSWAGHWDCHVEPDWVLLYKVTAEALVLVRTGTHADLFGL
jgi:mRNA interferase YafQ